MNFKNKPVFWASLYFLAFLIFAPSSTQAQKSKSNVRVSVNQFVLGTIFPCSGGEGDFMSIDIKCNGSSKNLQQIDFGINVAVLSGQSSQLLQLEYPTTVEVGGSTYSTTLLALENNHILRMRLAPPNIFNKDEANTSNVTNSCGGVATIFIGDAFSPDESGSNSFSSCEQYYSLDVIDVQCYMLNGVTSWEGYGDEADNGYCFSGASSTGRLDSSNGMAETPIISPNPFYQEVRVDLEGKNASSIRVHDISGRVVYQTQVAENAYTVELSLAHLPKGIYVLTLAGDDMIETQRIVKAN